MTYNETVIEIFTATRADRDRADYGQKVFLVTLNESGEQYDGTIMWDCQTYEGAKQEAREMSEEEGGAPIVDLVPADIVGATVH